MRKLFRAFFLFAAVLAASCAPPPKEAVPELYWPMPPERPRVKFLDVIMGSLDVTGGKAGLKRLVFGEEKEVNFAKPLFVAVRDDVVYVTDVNRVQVYDFANKKFKMIRGGFLMLTGIAIDKDGMLYVGDSAKNQVFMINSVTGDMKALEGPGVFDSPGGLAVDNKNGRLIVPDAKRHDVRVYNLKGEHLFTIGKRGPGPGDFNFPYAAAADAEGRIYVVDSGNFRVQVFDIGGGFLREFGGVGTAFGNFARPKGIAVDSDGHIYVVDASFGNFQIFDLEGNVYLSVGVGGVEAGKFILPVGIAIDDKDKIYVVDQMNARVQVLQYIKYPDENASTPSR